jgi:hypothetical protein
LYAIERHRLGDRRRPIVEDYRKVIDDGEGRQEQRKRGESPGFMRWARGDDGSQDWHSPQFGGGEHMQRVTINVEA